MSGVWTTKRKPWFFKNDDKKLGADNELEIKPHKITSKGKYQVVDNYGVVWASGLDKAEAKEMSRRGTKANDTLRGFKEGWKMAMVKKKKKMLRISTNRKIGHRIADIGPGGKEHNVKTKNYKRRKK